MSLTHTSSLNFLQSDEAEGIVAMVSEWLDLDSPDDGVRHDAEIVCHSPYSGILDLSKFKGTATRASLCHLPQHLNGDPSTSP